MQEFLNTILSMPTVVFTVLLGMMVLYWISVVAGALDIELFDPGSLDGVDGALEGVDGALEGADGALEGADGAAEGADGAAEGDADAEGGPSGLAGALHALRLRYAPLTIVISFIALFGWVVSFFASQYLAPVIPGGAWIGSAVVLVVAVVVAIPLTSLITRPMAPLFHNASAKKNRDLIGLGVTIRTGRVDASFGQATLDDGQAKLLLHVRCEADNTLARGDQALIVNWNEDANTFDVEPMDALLGGPDGSREAD
ncbi:MAG TPA: DUF1449 family protein [Polyangiaceae bacterium]|nr:DUF1449 family protein [Polyangiaceae bacterium]